MDRAYFFFAPSSALHALFSSGEISDRSAFFAFIDHVSVEAKASITAREFNHSWYDSHACTRQEAFLCVYEYGETGSGGEQVGCRCKKDASVGASIDCVIVIVACGSLARHRAPQINENEIKTMHKNPMRHTR